MCRSSIDHPGTRTPIATRAAAICLLGFAACVARRTPAPPSIAAGRSAVEVREALGCAGVYDLDEGLQRFRVLVFHDPRDDFRIVVYRLAGGELLRHGPEINLIGFSEPAPSPRCGGCIRTVHLDTGDAERLHLTASDAVLIPERGEWEAVPPAPHAEDRLGEDPSRASRGTAGPRRRPHRPLRR